MQQKNAPARNPRRAWLAELPGSTALTTSLRSVGGYEDGFANFANSNYPLPTAIVTSYLGTLKTYQGF